MPVTVKVASHDSVAWRHKTTASPTTAEFLRRMLYKDARELDEILQTSIDDSFLSKNAIQPEMNGLVMTVFGAYTNHQNLIIRPEDVWFAVLSQFSFFINAHSEKFRGSFVSHEGKKGLILEQDFGDGRVDFGSMCENMTRLIEQNIVDSELRSWILPSFTTTTAVDSVVSSALMMGMLQKYFEYICDPITCGIPKVTLMGEKADYEDILKRVDKLSEYGREPTHFARLLRPILKNMIATFTADLDDMAIISFWSRFALWNEDGECLAKDAFIDHPIETGPTNSWQVRDAYQLENVIYHPVDMQKIPASFTTVPLIVISDHTQLEAKILAGSIGTVGVTAPIFSQPTSSKSNVTPKSTPWSRWFCLPCFSTDDTSFEEEPNKPRKGFRSPSTAVHDKSPKAKPMDKLNDASDNGVSDTASMVPPAHDTLQPLTGWWIYALQDGKIGISREDFLKKKRSEWQGGSSTGHVNTSGKRWVRQDGSEEGFQYIG